MKLAVRFFSTNKLMFIYGVLCTIVALIASQFLDLPPLIGNWEKKAWSILEFNLTDNYYPPGAALALIPFLWSGPDFWPALYFYYALSSMIYFEICKFVPNKKFRIAALAALPANTYLTWLCLTSADQVVELLTLLLFGLFALRKRFALALLSGFLLSFTRPAYWVVFILIIFLMAREKRNSESKPRNYLRQGAAVWVLFAVLAFNKVVFGSVNLASSSGDTIYFSHQKFHYLSLPKFDMDVLLKNGPSTKPEVVADSSDRLNFIEDYKTRAAFISILENPQRFLFAQMQKVDSYFFPIQKIPHLPGQYELAEDEKSILIGDERLTWSLTIGYIIFAMYRAIWMLLFAGTLVWLGLLIFSRGNFNRAEKYLLLPYLAGVVPGFLYYVETRFKICSELLAIPLHLIALHSLKELAKSMKLRSSVSRND
ncbi:MAG: hypothetical protein EBX19_03665 [Actinobacteria bacterium]|nr:hypothetical protein [Actinomycetota bacterium]